MTSLLENCFLVCLHTVCLHSLPHNMYQYAYTQYPLNSILHSMPNSMPRRQYDYTHYPTQYASQYAYTKCISMLTHSIL